MTEPLNFRRLEDVLRANEQSQPDFLNHFRQSVDADAQRLEEAVAMADTAQARRLAHRIEGAAKVIGAVPLARACRALSQAEGPGELRRALDAFLACRSALYACVDMLVAGPAAASDGGADALLCRGLVFMLVEDHDFQRRMIVRLLQQLGAQEVHAFADGASALAAAMERRTPAVLVLDLAMPDLDGMEVMRIVGQEKLPLAVIVNSARGDDLLEWSVLTASSRGARVLGAVSKPLTAAKLAPLLAQHRQKRDRAVDPSDPGLLDADRTGRPGRVGEAVPVDPAVM